MQIDFNQDSIKRKKSKIMGNGPMAKFQVPFKGKIRLNIKSNLPVLK